MSIPHTSNQQPAGARTSAEIEAELSTLLPGKADPAETSTAEPNLATAAAAASESAASLKGWVPKDKYTGDPAKWVDARTFIDRGDRFNQNLQRQVQQLQTQLAGFEGTKTAFKKFHEETLAAKDVELKAAISELRLQRSQAIREGDDEGAIQLEDRIDLLKDQRKSVKELPAETAPAQHGPNPSDPVLLEWIADGNAWFQDDTALRDYAITVGEGLLKSGVTDRGRKFLDMVATKMAEEFPRRFKAAAVPSTRQNPVEGGANKHTGNNGGSKTEADLPDEDRALMKQFIKEGYVTKDAFLKSYFSRNP